MTHADKVKLAHAVLAGYSFKRFPASNRMKAGIPHNDHPGYRGWYWRGDDTIWIGAFNTQRECVEDVMQRVLGYPPCKEMVSSDA